MNTLWSRMWLAFKNVLDMLEENIHYLNFGVEDLKYVQ